MIGRWVPPAHSPIAVSALVAGAGAACGLLDPLRETVRGELVRTFAAREALLTDSGTSALVLALRACVPPGGTVALPAYGCIDLVAAAECAEVRVRLYDLDPETLAPDLESVAAVLQRGAAAIVVTPLYGFPVAVDAVTELARARGTAVIEDAAQSAGGTLGQRRAGAFGDLAVLSFGRGKGTTGGSGGALLVHAQGLGARIELEREADTALRARADRGVGDVVKLAAQWLLARPSLYALPSSVPALKLGEMVYHRAGEPCGISAAASRIVRAALVLDPAEVTYRRARARALDACVATSHCVRAIRPLADAVPGYLRFPILDRVGALEPVPRLGILRGYPVTLDEHPVTKGVLAPGEHAGAGARTLRNRLLTVPTHSRVSGRGERALERWLRHQAAGAGALHPGGDARAHA